MSLDTAQLKIDLTRIFKIDDSNPNPSVEDTVEALAKAIEEFVMSGEVVGVKTDVNVNVTTTGTATEQEGTGTGTGVQKDTAKIE